MLCSDCLKFILLQSQEVPFCLCQFGRIHVLLVCRRVYWCLTPALIFDWTTPGIIKTFWRFSFIWFARYSHSTVRVRVSQQHASLHSANLATKLLCDFLGGLVIPRAITVKPWSRYGMRSSVWSALKCVCLKGGRVSDKGVLTGVQKQRDSWWEEV